ncbi:MAG TPA: amidohydrolase family protein [Thermomicrobiales bacterium]|nr:amidohydrolase family protein [Thermomicrobiales bacterium]
MIDVHAHLGDGLFGLSLTVDDLLASMAANGIEHTIVSPLKPITYQFGPANDALAAAVSAHPQQLSGLGRVDPWQGADAVQEAVRCLDDLGLAGLFLHPDEEHFPANDEIVFPLMEILRDRQRPLMLAGGYRGTSHPSQIGDLARQFPDVTIVATHGGQLNISGMLLLDAMRMFQAHPNVLFETSGVYREDFIEDVVTELGVERVLFGSNAPYMDQGFETLRVSLAHCSDDQKRQIGRENAVRVFQLPVLP